MFSILILTYNEEKNLPECLHSIAWCDDIWILDSGSSDKTIDIAKAHGCKILTRKFDNFGNQRNYAIDYASFKYPWVFDLDADERFTQALKMECEVVVKKDIPDLVVKRAPHRVIIEPLALSGDKIAGTYDEIIAA